MILISLELDCAKTMHAEDWSLSINTLMKTVTSHGLLILVGFLSPYAVVIPPLQQHASGVSAN